MITRSQTLFGCLLIGTIPGVALAQGVVSAAGNFPSAPSPTTGNAALYRYYSQPNASALIRTTYTQPNGGAANQGQTYPVTPMGAPAPSLSGFQPVAHQEHMSNPFPPDPKGPRRMELPTPVEGFGLAGAPKGALNTSPDPLTMGIRLDTSFPLLRSLDVGGFYSEHQDVGAFGLTLLPIQTPCWIVGTRLLGTRIENLSMLGDSNGLSIDSYVGSRYKMTYFKVGSFWDWQDAFGKIGLSASVLTKVPILGFLTTDSAFAWGLGDPRFGPTRDLFFGVNPRRVANADFDMQIRVGKFFTENLQIGGTGNYYEFEFNYQEWSAGGFANIYWGRFRFGLEVTGGDEGLRGFSTLSVNWGPARENRPQDCRFIPVDTVAWVTRATDRDISVRNRESFTGVLPPAP